jgi:uncharacterized protein YcbK (DUF882 family)
MKTVVCATAAWGLARAVPCLSTPAATGRGRPLRMYHIHTGERIEADYRSKGRYDEEALDRINWFLRCYYTDTVKPISPAVIDLLCDVRDRVGYRGEIEIISGYRSPEYNAYLHSIGHHVAGGSLHVRGLAIDFSMPGVGTSRLARTARLLAAGGVGRYPAFVHIDTGRVRYW